MKRDMDVVRDILLSMEAADDEQRPDLQALIDSHGQSVVWYHIAQMHEAGLIKAVVARSLSSSVPKAHPLAILPDGHDFLANIRDAGLWERVKKKAGSAALQIVMGVAMTLAADEAKRRITGGT